MNILNLLLVALGGASGAVTRAIVAYALPSRFPWSTLIVNAAGSLAIGWLLARLGASNTAQGLRTQALLVTGFCGGFTTFSTFSWQTLDQMMKGQWLAAAINVILSVVLCLFAVWLGWRLGTA